MLQWKSVSENAIVWKDRVEIHMKPQCFRKLSVQVLCRIAFTFDTSNLVCSVIVRVLEAEERGTSEG